MYSQLDLFGRKYYKGEFVDGLRHGHGSMAWQDGTIYQGEWKFGQVIHAVNELNFESRLLI